MIEFLGLFFGISLGIVFVLSALTYIWFSFVFAQENYNKHESESKAKARKFFRKSNAIVYKFTSLTINSFLFVVKLFAAIFVALLQKREDPATDKQINYALSLGIENPERLSKEELSEAIDYAKSIAKPTDKQIKYALSLGIRNPEQLSRAELSEEIDNIKDELGASDKQINYALKLGIEDPEGLSREELSEVIDIKSKVLYAHTLGISNTSEMTEKQLDKKISELETSIMKRMATDSRKHPNAIFPYEQPEGLGPNGRKLCSWCHNEVPKRRRTFCSDECRQQHAVASNRLRKSYARK